MGQPAKLSPCEKILKFGRRRWHATHDLVAANAGKHDPIPMRGKAHPHLRGSAAVVAGSWHKARVRRFRTSLGRGPFFQADVDVPAGAAPFFFDFGEIGAFVPVGFGVVVVGHRIQARGFGAATGDDPIGHANDGGGVPPAAKFGEHRSIGTEFMLNGLREDSAEVLLVFGVGAVTDTLGGIEIPIFADRVLSGAEQHGRRRRDSMNTNAGCQMHGRKHREPAGDVLFVECEGFASKPDEWIEDCAPGDLIFVERIVEMARTDGIFDQEQ